MKSVWGDMSDKSKTMILFSVAVIFALFVALLSYNWLQKKSIVTVQATETQPVVVAVADLSWGMSLNNEYMKVVPFLKSSLPPGYHPDPSALAGRVVIYPVKANEPILESRLAPQSVKGGGVAAVITPGKRAMAVKVDKVVGVAGFINPGHRVDVLVTLAKSMKSGEPITKTVLENILVLATGTEIEKAGKQEKAAQVDVITLEVAPEEGEKLALAATEGKLQLALRNIGDQEDVITKGTTIPVLLTSYASSSTVAKKTDKKPSRAPQRGGYTVELIKGDTINYKTF